MKNLILTLIGIVLLGPGCKKSDSPEPTPQETKDISLITTTAIPGELVIAQANFQPAKDSATIVVGGKSVYAIKADSNQIVFVLPELPANTAATIQYQNMGLNKQLSIAVGNYTPVAQPDVVINEFTAAMDEIIQNYQEYENSPYIKLDSAYGNLIKYAKENFSLKLATLSAEQRKQVAYTISAYALNPHESKINNPNPAFFARTTDYLDDPEDEFNSNASTFLSKSTLARGRIVLGAAIMVLSLESGPLAIATSLGGAYIFLDGVNKLTNAQAESYNKSVNSVVVRTIGVEKANRMLKVQADTMTLIKDTEKRIVFYGTFRSLVQSDATTTGAAMKRFFTAKGVFEDAFAKATSVYESFKRILGGLAPDFPSSNPPLRTTPLIKKIAMQGAKLTLTNVSNPAITIAYTREDTALRIKVSSTTITTPTPFSFDLVYTNPNTGTTVTDKIYAIYKMPELASLNIVSGNNQTGQANSSLYNPLVVVVKDATGQAMPGIIVNWSVTTGDGQLIFNSTTNNANGQASNNWKLGATGTQTVTATVKKPDGSEISTTFSAEISKITITSYAVGRWICTDCACNVTYYKTGQAQMIVQFDAPPDPEAFLQQKIYLSDGSIGEGIIFYVKELTKINATTYSFDNAFCWPVKTTVLQSEVQYMDNGNISDYKSNSIRITIARP